MNFLKDWIRNEKMHENFSCIFFAVSYFLLYPWPSALGPKKTTSLEVVFLSHIKISLGVFVADTPDDASKRLFIVRVLSVFNPSSDKVTENPSEVIVTGVGEE